MGLSRMPMARNRDSGSVDPVPVADEVEANGWNNEQVHRGDIR